MKGKVKWFSTEKGYGFITPEGGEDLYFNVQTVMGADLPCIGDLVEFNPQPGKGDKGPKAFNVAIKERATGKNNSRPDDRVECPSCGKKIVPRIILGPPFIRGAYGYTPEAKKSVCPYCAATVKVFDTKGCFIATSVYGDYDCYQVMALRKFRDMHLEQNFIGRVLVRTYYKISPPIANWLRGQPWLAAKIRLVLDSIVKRLENNL